MTSTPHLDKLRDLVQTREQCEAGWNKLTRLRQELAAAVADPAIDTSEVQSFVSTGNKLAKLDVPEIAELRAKVSELQQELYSSKASEIYDAQLALQLADEALAQLMTTPEIHALQLRIDELVRQHAESQPARTRFLIVKSAARSLLAEAASTTNDNEK